MELKKVLVNLVYVMLAIVLVASLVVYGILPISPVMGSGTSTDNITSASTNYDGYFSSNPYDYFPNCATDDTPNLIYSSNTYNVVGMQSSTVYTNRWMCVHATMGFDLSGYSTENVTSATLWMYRYSRSNTSGNPMYVAVYTGENVNDSLEAGDGSEWYPSANRVSNIVDIDDYTDGEWISWDLADAETGEIDFMFTDSGIYWPYVLCTYQATLTPPAWPGTSKVNTTSFYAYQSAYKPFISLTVSETEEEREVIVDDNDAVDTSTDGSEVAENITWCVPRSAYADLGLYFQVEGDSGADITLDLLDEDGNSLLTGKIEDSIRVDGNYDCYIDLPNDFYGFVRLVEEEHNIFSEWGYCMPSRSSTMPQHSIMARGTIYPEYEEDMEYYRTYIDDTMVLHWRTNIQDDELSTHSLKMYSNSDNATEVFDRDLDELNTMYFHCEYEDNEALIPHSYMILSPKVDDSGFEDYDGMIWDMNWDYSTNRAGFIHAIIESDDESYYVDSHQCYWYLPEESDGVRFRIDRPSYNAGEDITITWNIGSACQIDQHLPSLNVAIISSSGVNIGNNDYPVTIGETEVIYEAPSSEGNYVVRWEFENEDCSWSYIHDIPFTVGDRSVEGDEVLDGLDDWLSRYGLDNAIGHWIFLIIAMFALFVACYKSPILRVAFPLLILGFGIFAGWVETWVIILLALVAGGALAVWARKMIGGR